jgi:multiple antibiotic resistance protein
MPYDFVASTVAFLVMLNPFALFIYLQPIMRDLSRKDFSNVLIRACVISFIIYYLHALYGNEFFKDVLQINFESFRLFGGIIIFAFAFVFIIGGKKTFLNYKENLNELASDIALPFMVGAGTISLSIIIGNVHTPVTTFTILATILGITYGIIMVLQHLREMLSEKKQNGFDKLMEIFLRINGFFIGAIGVNMVITAINNLYF